MALKAVLSEADHAALPEPIRAHYKKETDGSFALDADGLVPKTKLDEFRENNVRLLKENDTLKPFKTKAEELESKFKDVDPEEYRTLKGDGKGKGKGKDADELKTVIADATKPLTEQIANLQKAVDTERSRANDAILDVKLSEAATAARVRPSALPDFKRRARDAGFTVHDGVMVAIKNGTPVTDTENPGAPLTLENWTARELAEATHLVQESAGGGAGPNGSSGGRGPAKVLKNPTPEEFGANLADIASGKVEVRT